MKSHNLKSLSKQGFRLSPLFIALALFTNQGLAATQTYTLDADFDQGVLNGLNHDLTHNQLQLNVAGSSFPVLWIANAGEDTLSKIDTTQNGASPGREIARYRTWFNAGGYNHGAWSGAAPSRTAVDTQGNAYVLDRWFGNNSPTLFKILNETFVDRNGNGVVDTSTDLNNNGIIELSEMKPLVDSNNNGVIDPNEIEDERIAWVKRVPDGIFNNLPLRPNGVGRSLCIGTDGNLWVGLYNNAEYYKVNSADGSTIAGPVVTPRENYGCLIDQDGTLWGSTLNSYLIKITGTNSNTGPYNATAIGLPFGMYGIGLRRDVATNQIRVILGGSSNSYYEYNPVTAALTHPAPVNYYALGVNTDNDGNILISKNSGGVAKFAPSGAVIWDVGKQAGTGSDARGVIPDKDGNIWQVHRDSHNISKFNGTDGSFMGVLPVGYEPYTYSDASGTAALSITTKTGTWNVVKDGGAAATQWGTVSWTANVPTGAGVKVEVRASDNPVQSGAFVEVFNGTSISPAISGRYLDVKVTLTANQQNESPVLFDLTVASVSAAKCDVDQDGDIDKIDLSLISKARGQTATANDPRDSDGDGKITPNDVKVCTTKCTRLSCATN